MSWRRKSPWTSRRGRRIWMSSEDDLPLSLLALVAPRAPRAKKKSTPRKRVTRAAAAAAVPPPPPPPTEVINLDETPESAEILNNVNTKIGTFMQSGSFISSDEDETEMIKAKTHKKASPNPFFISDDSDDDCRMKQPNSTSNFDTSKPSTSTGSSTDPTQEKKPIVLDDDIMEFVDSVLDTSSCSKSENKQNQLKDMKSLEDFRKETEEMLKNASCLLDEIKTGRKPEPQVKEQESPKKVSIGVCPVCLESLASRPASVTVCGHIFCKECIMQTAQTLKKCPTCRKAINCKKIHPIYF